MVIKIWLVNKVLWKKLGGSVESEQELEVNDTDVAHGSGIDVTAKSVGTAGGISVPGGVSVASSQVGADGNVGVVLLMVILVLLKLMVVMWMLRLVVVVDVLWEDRLWLHEIIYPLPSQTPRTPEAHLLIAKS